MKGMQRFMDKMFNETYTPDLTQKRLWDMAYEKQGDLVNAPKHYNMGNMETVDAIMGMGLDSCEGNVVKYVARHQYKNGVQDLEKAKRYLELMIENYDEWYG